ncbi:MAG: Hsp20/alpha crystallin family protein [Bacteroidia bacterium]|nr:Hsp20/alpha crystallin family protein [Bacteroidia bacterium]
MTLVKFKNGNSFDSLFPHNNRMDFPTFFNDVFDNLLKEEKVSWMPAVNIMERENDYKIDLAVPGLDKKDFNIEVENNMLVVSGERKEEKVEEKDKVTKREFHYGSFKRSFTLPEIADVEKINASYNNGVLSVSIAKKEEAKQNSKRQIIVD